MPASPGQRRRVQCSVSAHTSAVARLPAQREGVSRSQWLLSPPCLTANHHKFASAGRQVLPSVLPRRFAVLSHVRLILSRC